MSAYGKIKVVANLEPLMGSGFRYLFLKVRSGPAEWQEEHWLVTEHEATVFEKRGGKADFSDVLTAVSHLGRLREIDREYSSDGLVVLTPDKRRVLWVLTPHDIEQVRYRSERNREDIAQNKESWLVDLFD